MNNFFVVGFLGFHFSLTLSIICCKYFRAFSLQELDIIDSGAATFCCFVFYFTIGEI